MATPIKSFYAELADALESVIDAGDLDYVGILGLLTLVQHHCLHVNDTQLPIMDEVADLFSVTVGRLQFEHKVTQSQVVGALTLLKAQTAEIGMSVWGQQ